MGGICEDGLTGVMTGVSGYGRHVGAGASYGAFIAPLGHIAARVHAISDQMRRQTDPSPPRPVVIVCGHAGLKTGEDGPTHADPQGLQLLQEDFVPGSAGAPAACAARPWVIVPCVTRPSEAILDRAALGLAPAAESARGVYRLKAAAGDSAGAVVLQGSEVTYAFVQETMPLLEAAGIDLDVYVVTSPELFDLLDPAEREATFPDSVARNAMGITGFTLPTMYRWVTGEVGRAHTLHPFRGGHYLGSGVGAMVIHEAGLDGPGQFAGITRFIAAMDAR